MTRVQTRAMCPECEYVALAPETAEKLACPDHGQFTRDEARWSVTA